MKSNWKTTLGGVLGAASVPLIASSVPYLHIGGLVLAMVASAWLGYHASDVPKV